VILQNGMERMFHRNEDIFYYITLYNENYTQQPMPERGAKREFSRGCTSSTGS
jgi:pyruvate dehydrogenase E1 component